MEGVEGAQIVLVAVHKALLRPARSFIRSGTRCYTTQHRSERWVFRSCVLFVCKVARVGELFVCRRVPLRIFVYPAAPRLNPMLLGASFSKRRDYASAHQPLIRFARNLQLRALWGQTPSDQQVCCVYACWHCLSLKGRHSILLFQSHSAKMIPELAL